MYKNKNPPAVAGGFLILWKTVISFSRSFVSLFLCLKIQS